MRQRIQQTTKADGPFSIRISVWLIVFGSVLICVLTNSLSRHHTSQLTAEATSDSSTHETGSRRTDHIEFMPATYESASFDFDDVQLTLIEEMVKDRRTWMDGESGREGTPKW
jgi:hypothetical protein